AITDPAARAAAFEKMVAAAYQRGKAVNMASFLEIDDVIDPAESRRWIMAGVRAAPAPAGRAGEERARVGAWEALSAFGRRGSEPKQRRFLGRLSAEIAPVCDDAVDVLDERQPMRGAAGCEVGRKEAVQLVVERQPQARCRQARDEAQRLGDGGVVEVPDHALPEEQRP